VFSETTCLRGDLSLTKDKASMSVNQPVSRHVRLAGGLALLADEQDEAREPVAGLVRTPRQANATSKRGASRKER
jgi:hypothetical protein